MKTLQILLWLSCILLGYILGLLHGAVKMVQELNRRDTVNHLLDSLIGIKEEKKEDAEREAKDN